MEDQPRDDEQKAEGPVEETGQAPEPSAQNSGSDNFQDVHEPKRSEEAESSDEDEGTSPEVQEELSKVASTPKSNILIFALIGVGFIFIVWNIIVPMIFSGDNKPEVTDTTPLPTDELVVKPSEESDNTPPIPRLPEPPKLVAPTAPPEPEPAPVPEAVPEPAAPVSEPEAKEEIVPDFAQQVASNTEDFLERKEMKRKSPIQLVGGQEAAKEPESEGEVQQVSSFKKRGDLNYVLGKGKIIDVVTESAINSDYVQEVRAVVVRNVYSESGKVVLIPKGTRVFGTFSLTTVEGGEGRVDIKWTRMDLASGYTLTLAGDAVDSLGRKGVMGQVDHKYKEKMANALLSSAFSVAVAAGVDKLIPPVEKTQAAANSALASNIQSTALATFQGADTSLQKITRICADVQGLMTDKTSSAFAAFVTACTQAQGTVGTDDARLTTLMSAVTAAATSVIKTSVEAATPTKKQKAAEEAFKSLSETAKNMLPQQNLEPTTTIDQGHPIKIYVNKDYLFPKDAIARTRILQ